MALPVAIVVVGVCMRNCTVPVCASNTPPVTSHCEPNVVLPDTVNVPAPARNAPPCCTKPSRSSDSEPAPCEISPLYDDVINRPRTLMPPSTTAFFDEVPSKRALSLPVGQVLFS